MNKNIVGALVLLFLVLFLLKLSHSEEEFFDPVGIVLYSQNYEKNFWLKICYDEEHGEFGTLVFRIVKDDGTHGEARISLIRIWEGEAIKE